VLALFLFVAGAVVGSFLGVVASRLPRGESLVRPRSRCDRCGHLVRVRDNLPVVSWLLLRGRCRDCGAPIPARLLAIELVTAALFGAWALRLGPAPDIAELALGLALIAILVVVAAIDFEHRIIPNRVLVPGAAFALAVVALGVPDELLEHALAAVASGGGLLVVALARPGGMGMGDVKLAATMGLYLGAAVAPALLAGFAAGAAVGVAIVVRQGTGARKRAIPFGPFLALGGLIGLFWGDQLVDWYLDSFVR